MTLAKLGIARLEFTAGRNTATFDIIDQDLDSMQLKIQEIIEVGVFPHPIVAQL